MSSPIAPNDFKATIPAAGASLCDKLAKAFTLPSLVYQWVAYMLDSNGKVTSEFATDICAAQAKFGGCNGISSQNPNMPSPVIQASDGRFSDEVQVTWAGVVTSGTIPAATFYKIYRSSNTIENTADAVLLTTVAAVVGANSYDDSTAVPGTVYWYWVKATNGTDESGFSTGNQGYAASVTGSLTAVSDLRVTKGHGAGIPISLVWTPVAGATKWDIYRNTSDDGTTATLIDSNRAPAATSHLNTPDPGQEFWDNDGELVYLDVPPDANQVYYYWVVAKKDSPPAVSAKSNSDWGTVNTLYYGQTTLLSLFLSVDGDTDTVLAGHGKMHFILRGSTGGGAGAGLVYGGGGSGSGAVIYGEHTPVVGAKYRLVTGTTGNAAAEANGAAGVVTKLQYSAAGTFGDTIDIATCAAPAGGLYNSAGGGTGGAGATGSVDASVTNSAIHAGVVGGAASSGTGGKSSYRFGGRRLPAAHSITTVYNTWTGTGGSGSNKAPFGAPSLATGGSGAGGNCAMAYAA